MESAEECFQRGFRKAVAKRGSQGEGVGDRGLHTEIGGGGGDIHAQKARLGPLGQMLATSTFASHAAEKAS